MQVGNDGRDCEAPFKAHREIGHDADDHQQDSERSALEKLFAHLRTHELDALEFDLFHALTARIFTVSNRARSAQRFEQVVAHLRVGDALNDRQTHQHILRRAEVLHHRLAGLQRLNRSARLAQIGRLCVTQFSDGAAREIDAVMQALVAQCTDSDQKGNQRNSVEIQRILHERKVFFKAEKFHESLLLFFGLFRFEHSGRVTRGIRRIKR